MLKKSYKKQQSAPPVLFFTLFIFLSCFLFAFLLRVCPNGMSCFHFSLHFSSQVSDPGVDNVQGARLFTRCLAGFAAFLTLPWPF